jgi:DNA-binding CsgD family transcriptional regulator
LTAEGAAIGRESGNRFAYGLCLTTSASLTGRFGDPVEAIGLYRLAVENWQLAGNWSNQRILLRNLAEHASRIGRYELTPRLLGGLTVTGEMLAADVGAEGSRLAEAVARARAALGDDRYDALVREGSRLPPAGLERAALDALDEASAAEPSVGPPVHPAAATPLTAREREVVELVSAGLTNQEIAARLFISERTVDTHISRIRRKLGTTTRTQLAIWGLTHA